jgi:hypothetical protein
MQQLFLCALAQAPPQGQQQAAKGPPPRLVPDPSTASGRAATNFLTFLPFILVGVVVLAVILGCLFRENGTLYRLVKRVHREATRRQRPDGDSPKKSSAGLSAEALAAGFSKVGATVRKRTVPKEERFAASAEWLTLWLPRVSKILTSASACRTHPLWYFLFWTGWLTYLLAMWVQAGNPQTIRASASTSISFGAQLGFLPNGTLGGPPWFPGHTCLQLPPQYDFDNSVAQAAVIPLVYGLMHSALFCLALLPLPMCHAVWGRLVALSPSVRSIVPLDNFEVFHRLLGTLALCAIALGGSLWAITMVPACIAQSVGGVSGRACAAFELNPGDPIRAVAMLRLIIAPLWGALLPLMAFAETNWAAADARIDAAQQKAGDSIWARWCVRVWSWFAIPAIGWVVLSGAACGTTSGVLLAFYSAGFSGRFGVAGGLIGAALGGIGGAALSTSQAVRVHWFEVCYWSHVLVAYGTVPLALLARFDVFWPCIPCWGMLALDQTSPPLAPPRLPPGPIHSPRHDTHRTPTDPTGSGRTRRTARNSRTHSRPLLVLGSLLLVPPPLCSPPWSLILSLAGMLAFDRMLMWTVDTHSMFVQAMAHGSHRACTLHCTRALFSSDGSVCGTGTCVSLHCRRCRQGALLQAASRPARRAARVGRRAAQQRVLELDLPARAAHDRSQHTRDTCAACVAPILPRCAVPILSVPPAARRRSRVRNPRSSP